MALLFGSVALIARELRAASASAARLHALDVARARRDAECEAAARRVDEIRAQTVALLIESVRLISMTDEHLSAWADETPQAWTLDPSQDRIRLAHSATYFALRLTRGGLAAFQEANHGR